MCRTVVGSSSALALRIIIIIVGGPDQTEGRKLGRLAMCHLRFSGSVYFKFHGHFINDAFVDIHVNKYFPLSLWPLAPRPPPSTTQVLFDFLLSVLFARFGSAALSALIFPKLSLSVADFSAACLRRDATVSCLFVGSFRFQISVPIRFQRSETS